MRYLAVHAPQGIRDAAAFKTDGCGEWLEERSAEIPGLLPSRWEALPAVVRS